METSPEQAGAILAAMRHVAEAGGSGAASARDLATIRGAQRHALSGAGFDAASALPRSNPAALAVELEDPAVREYAQRFLMAMAFVDGSVDAQRLLLIGDYANTLALDDGFVEETYWAARQQFRFVATYLLGARVAGIRDNVWIAALLATLFPAYAAAADPDLRARYHRLRLLPSGSLGRGVYDHHRVNGLPFPGEPDSVGERFGTAHDVTHIVGEFALSPADEICAAAFSAGMAGRVPEDTIFGVLFGYRLGILDLARYGRTSLDGRRFWSAFRCGSSATIDFFGDDFHFWDLVEEPLDTLRDKCNITDDVVATSYTQLWQKLSSAPAL